MAIQNRPPPPVFGSFFTAHTSYGSLADTLIAAMDAKHQRPKERKDAVSSLNAAIEILDLAERTSNITPAKAVLGSVGALLVLIRVCFLLSCNDLPQVHTWSGLGG